MWIRTFRPPHGRFFCWISVNNTLACNAWATGEWRYKSEIRSRFMLLLRFIRHLRLPFQFVLAPVFLLGYALADASLSMGFAVSFILVHVGLYGGATAYNSYWDRDKGPIGGMKYPPGVGQWEHIGGLAVQAGAVLGMGWVDWRMGFVGLVMMGMGIAYSHPRWRWKARPWGSLLTVTLGQGILPFFLGWWAGDADGMRWAIWLALVATALLITGFYPLTQVYQIAEDSARGDCSFAVRFGPSGVFALGRGLVGFAAVLFVLAIWQGGLFQPGWLLGIPLAYAVFYSALHWWQRRFAEQDEYQNHDWAFAICAGMSGSFWAFVLVELLW